MREETDGKQANNSDKRMLGFGDVGLRVRGGGKEMSMIVVVIGFALVTIIIPCFLYCVVTRQVSAKMVWGWIRRREWGEPIAYIVWRMSIQ